MEIPQVLTEFVYRLSFGLALAMACVSPRMATSDYFRVHSYVVLGLSALLIAVAMTEPGQFPLWPAVATALGSYGASVAWLYEKPRTGRALLMLAALAAALGAWIASPVAWRTSMWAALLPLSNMIVSGMLMGFALAAMLLGHWYLNSPRMRLEPIRRLVLLLGAAVVARGLISLVGLAPLLLASDARPTVDQVAMLTLHLLAGVLGTGIVTVMTWFVLKVPNTQSATGLLYVAVILTFLGELTALLLSVAGFHPV